jgi:chorismate synthase
VQGREVGGAWGYGSILNDDTPLHRSPTLALTPSAVLQQNARTHAASLLPPLTHLPPTMVLPGKDVVQKVAAGQKLETVQSQKPGEE